MKSHNEEMRISDELPGPYDVEERRTVKDAEFQRLHPEWDAEKHKGKKRLAVLARMLEMKEAKLRTAVQLQRDHSFYAAEVSALSWAIERLGGKDARQNEGNGGESDGRLNESAGSSGTGADSQNDASAPGGGSHPE